MWTEGVLGSTSFAVTQRAAGANFSVDVAAGRAVIQGDDQANQGKYEIINTATVNKPISAAPGSNSRYTIVIAQLRDPDAGGAAGDDYIITTVDGSSAASPTVPATPASALLLAVIGPIASGTASITTSLIADNRTIARLAHDVLAPGVVVTTKIADLNVTTAKIADNAVTNGKLAVDAVGNSRIAASAVTGDKIANATITEAKLDALVLSQPWTNVTFATGWQATAGLLTLRYKKIGNVGFLAGTAQRNGGATTGSLVATLPVGMRPPISVGGNTETTVTPYTIATDGTITLTTVANGSSYSIHVAFEV